MEHPPSSPSDVEDSARRAARWAGVSLSPDAWSALDRYGSWLVDEAVPAGGLGPREAPRVRERHLADSLTFARPWGDTAPTSLLDVGTGVGLPGIPLALAYPATSVVLLDRGGRRTRLVERALRVLGLDEVAVVHRDVADVSGRFDGITFRGSLRPTDAIGTAARLLAPDGVAVLGLSRRRERPDGLSALIEQAALEHLVAEAVQVPEGVLDAPSWLLMIRRSGHPVAPARPLN